MRSNILTILLPVCNEEELIEDALRKLRNFLDNDELNYEIIFCENGSSDTTLIKCKGMSFIDSNVKVITFPHANYGRAVKEGIFASNGKYIICYDIDHIDLNFIKQSLPLLEKYDIVIGSKLLKGSKYGGPLFRKLVSHIYNFILKISINFKGTDSHGIKAYNSNRIKKIATYCIAEYSMFTPELLIRAYRADYRIKEIPVNIYIDYKRNNYWKMIKKIPRIISDIFCIKLSFLQERQF